MIVTKLVGGLGNQMFQYAAGRALALRHGTEVLVDRRAFGDYKLRAYGLDCFVAKPTAASAAMLPRMSGGSRVHRMLRRLISPYDYYYACESQFTYDPSFLSLPDNTYLDGYWQSERYFCDFAEVIRSDFSFSMAPSLKNAEWLDHINDVMSVSVHVRRGDYVHDPQANYVHGTCSLEYYEQAISCMRERLDIDPVLFVFSDDPEWVMKHINIRRYSHYFITNNDANTNYEDLRLMANCKHHIIANSTFSWWGAWLNLSTEKIVVAPRRWFRTDNLSDVDLIPDSWLRV